jgi:hypothetical protein
MKLRLLTRAFQRKQLTETPNFVPAISVQISQGDDGALSLFARRQVPIRCLPQFLQLLNFTVAESDTSLAQADSWQTALAEPVVRGTRGNSQALRQFSNSQQSIHMGCPGGKTCKTTKLKKTTSSADKRSVRQ